MNKIKVSVIIYVKNTVSYIEQCVRSVMNQTLREIEIMVIDGGSTDGTLEILGKLQKEDERIRLLNASASVGIQFNLGLSKAKGEFVSICEADDYILPDMLEKEYEVAHRNELDVIRADYYQFFNVFGRECRFYTRICFLEGMVNKLIEGLKDDFFLKQGVRGFWSGLYRRIFLINNNIRMNETAGASHQDITFSFMTQMFAKKIFFMDEAFYCYRIDNPDASVNSEKCIQAHMQEYEYLAKELKQRGLWEMYKNMYYSWELSSYRYFINHLPHDMQDKVAKKIYKQLKEQNDKECYEKEDILEHLRGVMHSLLGGEKEFLKELRKNSLNHKRMLDYFNGDYVYDDDIVIFGIGHMGTIVTRFLDLSGKNFFLVDNNERLCREGFEGKKVFSPEEIVKDNPFSTYIIANINYTQDMMDQLMKLGIKDDKMIVCCDEDLFLRKVFAKGRR